jgi:pyruvate kinase
LSKIAASIEPHRPGPRVREELTASEGEGDVRFGELITFSVEATLKRVTSAAVFVPTHSGATARSMTRFRLPVWIVAVSSQKKTCQALQFSYGVYPVHEPDDPENWNEYARNWLQSHGVHGNLVFLTEGPS